MHARYVDGISIRPLRDGDTETVASLFARRGSRSRERRFCGAKPRLGEAELAALSRVDAEHHVLVAYVERDSRPAGIARLVRGGGPAGRSAEIAFEVADQHQGRGIGSVLARELAADARAAGITELVATVCGDNAAVVSLLRRVAGSLQVTWQGREREFVLGLER
jgi:ribosomal protein S18 acetylase RimI-like enzyme